MRIGYDATSLFRKITGIEQYALNLLKSIIKYDNKNQYTVFFRKEIYPDFLNLRSKIKFKVCLLNSQVFCEQFWLPYRISKEKLDVVHFPAFPPGLFVPKKYIVTLHDATMWKYKQTISWKNKIYMKPLTNIALRKADKIITVSDSSKKDIVKYCKVDERRIINTGESISDAFCLINDREILEKTKLKLNLPDKFILYVGSIEPRKNLATLLKAYKLLRRKRQDLIYKLVLVGRKAWGDKEIKSKIFELGIERDVLQIGYVRENDLNCIYNLAKLFVFPSIYEGFGLPPLEAMSCGVPVLVSNVSSLPEILGDAAVLIPPLDTETMAKKIEILLENSSLREDLIRKGMERVKLYSWEKVVRKTIEAYESIQ